MAEWGKILSRGNVEDRRGLSPAVGGLGLTGIALVVIFNLLMGAEPADILGQVLGQLEQSQVQPQTGREAAEFAGEDSYEVFASTVLGSNNELWQSIFQQAGYQYVPPKLVLFRNATASACGTSTSAVGPHYCPLDKTIYLDETFFEALQSRLGAEGGDVAEAYVMAHEVGHHAQNELGLLDEVARLSEDNPKVANAYAIKLELQADCFAGLWAHSLRDLQVFEPGEMHEAMDAAAAVGDDRVQERTTGRVNPENWTHGSSEERAAWLDRGFQTGQFNACNTLQ